ncbi:hypothetical protein [Paenibacillus qinlingensis]|uniref:Uncharacterized protein n=1 Tax=Paenibacillus qinlingensis TaxID=1837343 RepID=A0ABU1NUH5_9BACL|nr:hypothetical protein [Paenibacillus qinlingensis]MDR6551108.1 hypothetical protein [Paenibacillus qinlingensis]
MNHSENGIGVGTLQVIADYQLERWLHTLTHEDRGTDSEDLNWQQLTQYAAYHAINAWYTMPIAARTHRALTQEFEKKWTNKVQKFGSDPFYSNVKHNVIEQLYGILSGEGRMEWPILLFESMDVWVDELDMGLSMIVQAMDSSQQSIVIHKFIMEDSAASLALFTHMSVVFCNKAFGGIPVQLQLVNLMSGKQHRIETNHFTMEQSLDYLRLVKDVYLESRRCTCCREDELHGNKFDMAIHQ